MSYLSLPRLAFAGQFQADVSTVNNDPRHFDSATFEKSFQRFQDATAMNGWWNPIGTGIFRLSGCRVQSASGPDGRAAPELRGYLVGDSPDRPSAKIVDLDPDWQLASQLFGLSISLREPATGRLVMLAEFEHAPFRDLWFSRGGGAGDSGASAMWQSVLTDVEWHLDGIESPTLRALADHSKYGPLSIRISTFAYQTSAKSPTFTYGTLLGCIGLQHANEPRTFIAGRRFMPLNGVSSASGISCFSGRTDRSGETLTVDLSNALPLDANGGLRPLGNLQFAVLKKKEAQQDASVGPEDFVALAPVDTSEASFVQYAGVQTVPVGADARDLIADHPLALVRLGRDGTLGGGVVDLRESADGREVRPDVFSFRLDPNEPQQNVRRSTFYATSYGRPLAGAKLVFAPTAPTPDTDDTPPSKNPLLTPKAPVPFTNSPAGAIGVRPLEPVTGAEGTVSVEFEGPPAFGNPRGYIDGQIYTMSYNFSDPPAAAMPTFDQVSVLVFSTFVAPLEPLWADVEPILKQYANLYPIMSRGLFDFSKQEIADANAHLLHFVFSKPVEDPDYMPVTRDLSAGKRRALLAYFERVMAREAGGKAAGIGRRVASRCPFSGVTPSVPPEDVGTDRIIFNKLRSR